MLIAHTTGLLLFGLSAENIAQLQAGRPIHITRKSHGLPVPPGLAIVIMAGETEQAIEADLRRMGAITTETVMNGRVM